jgi:DNA-directed RNA polymerase specialized sigma24 family protein
LCANVSDREDLYQDGCIFLAWTREQKPGHTPSWHLQRCEYQLRHILGSGRSIDSAKRRHLGRPIEAECEDSEPGDPTVVLTAADDTLQQVCRRDFSRQVRRCLNPRNQWILDCVADGLRQSEIAAKLGTSRAAVLKRFRQIEAATAALRGCG